MSPDPWPGDSTTPGPADDELAQLIDILVAQTLDDLEEGRLDVEQALRRIAAAAWHAARQRPPDAL